MVLKMLSNTCENDFFDQALLSKERNQLLRNAAYAR